MTIADLTRLTLEAEILTDAEKDDFIAEGIVAAASRAADRLGVTREALLRRVVEGDGVARAYLKAEA
jgi:hypothetical protein